MCAHAYKNRKWRPTATDSRLVCLWLLVWLQSEFRFRFRFRFRNVLLTGMLHQLHISWFSVTSCVHTKQQSYKEQQANKNNSWQHRGNRRGSSCELSTCWVFVDLHALMSIRFVYKWWWVLKLFVSYHCWTKSWWEENDTFVFNSLPRCFWKSLWVLLVVKSLEDIHWALLCA